MPDEKSSQKPPREPQALSSEYHKARKQLMLWAGILFIWELVGIDLEKAKEAGGGAGAVISSIKSPQAVPWALLVLIVYFAFKLRVEWGQCSLARREVRESRLDYYSAFIVAGLALVLYFGQTISRMQFANAVQDPSRLSSVLLGAAIIAGILTCVYFLWERFAIHGRERNDLIFIAFAFPTVLLIGPVITLLQRGRPQWKYLLLGTGIGIATYVPALLLMARKTRRAYANNRT